MSEIPTESKRGQTRMTDLETSFDRRSDWLRELAEAPGDLLLRLWKALEIAPDYEVFRGPEIGLVMLRGRAGGVGAPFNLGEATATRCSLRLDGGAEGHAVALGRDKAKATVAALCDALMQTNLRNRIESDVLRPLAAQRADRRRVAEEKAAATRVEFFTMVRGEDD